jgi:hypothetical protein
MGLVLCCRYDLSIGRSAIASLAKLCAHVLQSSHTSLWASFELPLINSFALNATPYSTRFTCIILDFLFLISNLET